MDTSEASAVVAPSVLTFAPKKAKRPTAEALEAAFDYFEGPEDDREREALNQERCLRSVRFLLTYCSEMGNEALPGDVAYGLAQALGVCLDRLPYARRKAD